MYNILTRGHDLISHGNDIITHYHDLLSSSRDLLCRFHDVRSRGNELIIPLIGCIKSWQRAINLTIEGQHQLDATIQSDLLENSVNSWEQLRKSW